jgi:hypothetical protein
VEKFLRGKGLFDHLLSDKPTPSSITTASDTTSSDGSTTSTTLTVSASLGISRIIWLSLMLSSIKPALGSLWCTFDLQRLFGRVCSTSILEQRMSLACMTYASNILVLSKAIRVWHNIILSSWVYSRKGTCINHSRLISRVWRSSVRIWRVFDFSMVLSLIRAQILCSPDLPSLH